MPSASLHNWQTVRLTSLGHVDAQCAACVAAVPPNVHLIDENLRAYVLLLAAHFQGFCRDLYTESAQVIVSRVRRPALEVLFQEQFSARRELDHSNAHFGTIVKDFNRFGFAAKATLDALPGALKADLHDLNEWRKPAAHQNVVLPAGGPLTVPMIQGWRNSCNTLAIELDRIMYNKLRLRLRRRPWPP
jgi:uncharacterized protein YaiE (UPF0345 family)